MSRRILSISATERRLAAPFVTARATKLTQSSVCIALEEDGLVGRGESSGVSYAGETISTMTAQIEIVRNAIEEGAGRPELLRLLPPGGARAACDAALWDLEAKLSGKSAWQLAGLQAAPLAITTATTISLSTPGKMEADARRDAESLLIKVKIGGGDGLDEERVRAVRAGAPGATLIADGNQGCIAGDLPALCRTLLDQGYTLLEQPLPVGSEDHLNNLQTDLPLCADESLDTEDDVHRLSGTYQFGNIKLDKCGGLTAALRLADALQDAGMGVFVGCMIGGARSIAPAFLLADRATYIDLDGPLWLADDSYPMTLDADGKLAPPPAEIWGG